MNIKYTKALHGILTGSSNYVKVDKVKSRSNIWDAKLLELVITSLWSATFHPTVNNKEG